MPKVTAALVPQHLRGLRPMRSAAAADRSGDPSAHRGHSVQSAFFWAGFSEKPPRPPVPTQSSCQKGPGKAEQVQERQGPWGWGRLSHGG